MFVQLSAPELRNLLINAIIFLDRTKNKVNDLDGVLLQEVNGSLCATATDRYRIVDILAETIELEANFRLFLSHEQAKEILEFIKPELKHKHSLIEIKSNPEIEMLNVSAPWSGDRNITMEKVEDRFPAARRLFDKVSTILPKERAVFQANIEHLASIARVKDHRPGADKNETMLVIPPEVENKAVLVLRGDWFRALLMTTPSKSGQHLPSDHHQKRFG